MLMGGIGSGRHLRVGASITVESCHSIDVRSWRRDGLLTPGNRFSSQWMRNGEVTGSISVQVEGTRVVLSYMHRDRGDDWERIEEPVRLDSTPCHFGGNRVWFRCPACGRRVAILYLPGRDFACRICYQLAYQSQRDPPHLRALRRAQKIRERLGGTFNMLTPFPAKPRNMRSRTYGRLRAEHDRASMQSDAAIASVLDAMSKRMTR